MGKCCCSFLINVSFMGTSQPRPGCYNTINSCHETNNNQSTIGVLHEIIQVR